MIMLPPSHETGALGIMHLKRYWQRSVAIREGALRQNSFQEEWNLDNTLLSALGLGLEQTIKFLYQEAPGFNEFEQWILELNGGSIADSRIHNFNLLITNRYASSQFNGEPVLNANDLQHWNTHGYVIVRNAVSKEDCAETIQAITDFLGISISDPSTWYAPHPARQGIMVQLFQHPILEKNRTSPKIRGAYEQLWGRTDLWMNTDRVSFNPPENERWHFPGPRLHWDVSLELPIPFGLQGLLYLSDTEASQGAFTLVPGFHHKIADWINSLPPGTDPRKEDLYQLNPQPIAANAGDFIIWHQALPHGSSPNTASQPRIVQYVNYLPVDVEVRRNWL